MSARSRLCITALLLSATFGACPPAAHATDWTMERTAEWLNSKKLTHGHRYKSGGVIVIVKNSVEFLLKEGGVLIIIETSVYNDGTRLYSAWKCPLTQVKEVTAETVEATIEFEPYFSSDPEHSVVELISKRPHKFPYKGGYLRGKGKDAKERKTPVISIAFKSDKALMGEVRKAFEHLIKLANALPQESDANEAVEGSK